MELCLFFTIRHVLNNFIIFLKYLSLYLCFFTFSEEVFSLENNLEKTVLNSFQEITSFTSTIQEFMQDFADLSWQEQKHSHEENLCDLSEFLGIGMDGPLSSSSSGLANHLSNIKDSLTNIIQSLQSEEANISTVFSKAVLNISKDLGNICILMNNFHKKIYGFEIILKTPSIDPNESLPIFPTLLQSIASNILNTQHSIDRIKNILLYNNNQIETFSLMFGYLSTEINEFLQTVNQVTTLTQKRNIFSITSNEDQQSVSEAFNQITHSLTEISKTCKDICPQDKTKTFMQVLIESKTLIHNIGAQLSNFSNKTNYFLTTEDPSSLISLLGINQEGRIFPETEGIALQIMKMTKICQDIKELMNTPEIDITTDTNYRIKLEYLNKNLYTIANNLYSNYQYMFSPETERTELKVPYSDKSLSITIQDIPSILSDITNDLTSYLQNLNIILENIPNFNNSSFNKIFLYLSYYFNIFIENIKNILIQLTQKNYFSTYKDSINKDIQSQISHLTLELSHINTCLSNAYRFPNDDKIQIYAQHIQELESIASRNDWILEQFSKAYIQSSPTHLNNLLRFLGSEKQSFYINVTILESLDRLLESFSNFETSIINFNSTENWDTHEDFDRYLTMLITQYKNFVDTLYQGYQFFIEQTDKTQHFEWPCVQKAQPTEISQLLDQSSLHMTSTTVTLLLILKNSVNKNLIPLNDFFYKLSPYFMRFKEIFASVFNKLSFFNLNSPGFQLSYTKLLESVKNTLDQLSFQLTHQTCWEEYIDSISRIKCITSSLASQIQKINCQVFNASIEDQNFFTLAIQTINESISSIENSILSISKLFNNDNCIMNHDFIVQMRNIEIKAKECFDQIEKIYQKSFNSSSGIKINPENLYYNSSDILKLLQEINTNIEGIVLPLSEILKKFNQNYETNIGLALSQLEKGIDSLINSIRGEEPYSLLSVLYSHNNSFCCHENIPIDEALFQISHNLEKFPVINTELCCSHIFPELKSIQNCCFKTFRLFQAIVSSQEMYKWEHHKNWKDIMRFFNQFLKSTLDYVFTGQKKKDEPCQSLLLKPYLNTLQEDFIKMCNNIDHIITNLKIPNFIPEFRNSYTHRGCETLALFMSNIEKILSETPNLFRLFFNNFDHSDYIFDEELQKIIQETSNLFHSLINQLGKNIPLFFKFCDECQKYPQNSDQNLQSAILSLKNSFNDVSEKLKIPLCCHHPCLVIKETNQILGKIDRVIQHITKKISSCEMSNEGIENLIFQMDYGEEVLSCISKILLEMKTEENSPKNNNPCIMLHFLPYFSQIKNQFQNLLNISYKISEDITLETLEDLTEKEEKEAPSCETLDNLWVLFQKNLESIFSHIISLNENFKTRKYTFFTQKLYQTFKKFLDKFSTLPLQCMDLYKNFPQSICKHTTFQEIGKATENISHALSETLGILQSFCCSKISKSFYKTGLHLQQIREYLTIVFENYSIEMLQKDPCIPIFRQWLEDTQKASDLLKAILEKSTEEITTPCFPENFIEDWNSFELILLSQQKTLKAFLENLHLENKQEVQEEEKTFSCHNTSEHILKMLKEYQNISQILDSLGKKLRQNPPLKANYPEILKVLSFYQTMSSNLGPVFSFLEQKYNLDSTKNLCELCSKIDFTSEIPSKDTSEKIKTSFDELLDILSKPGCCTYVSDEIIQIANICRFITRMLKDLSNLKEINIHTSYLQKTIQCLETLEKRLRQVHQKIDIPKIPFSDAYCSNYEMLNNFKEIRLSLEEFYPSILEFMNLLGIRTNLNNVDLLSPDRRKSGCEILTITMEDLALTVQNWIKYEKSIIKIILNAPWRAYSPSFLEKFDLITKIISIISQRILTIAYEYSQSNPCDFCISTTFSLKEKKAFSDFAQNFVHFSKILEEDSEEALSGILHRYSNSGANIIIYKISKNLNSLQKTLENIANHDTIFTFSFHGALQPSLDDFQKSYQKIYQYVISFQEYISQKDFDLLNFELFHLKKIESSTKQLKKSLKSLATFIGCPPLSTSAIKKENINFYQATDFCMKTLRQSLSGTHQTLKQITINMKHQKTPYAYNEPIIHFLEKLETLNWQKVLDAIFDDLLYKYFDFSIFKTPIKEEITQLTQGILSLKSSFMQPLCYQNLEEIGQKIALKSDEIRQMCDRLMDFKKNDSFIVYFKNFFKEGEPPFKALQAFFKDSIQKLLTPYPQDFSTLEELKICFQTLYEDSLIPFHDLLVHFLEFCGIPQIDYSNFLSIQSLSFQDQIEIFQLAFEKVENVFQKIFEITLETPVIPYDSEVLESLERTLSYLKTAPEDSKTCGKLSKLGCLSYFHQKDRTLEQIFTKLSNNFYSIRKYMDEIGKNLQEKCCSEFFVFLKNLAFSFAQFQFFLEKSIYENPYYTTYLFNTVTPHKFLNILNNPQDGILQRLLVYLENILAILHSIDIPSQNTYCLNKNIFSTLDNLTKIMQEASQGCQNFYNQNVLGPSIEENESPPIKTISSLYDFMNNILETLNNLKGITAYLKKLHNEVNYTINSHSLLESFKNLASLLNQLSQTVSLFKNYENTLCSCCKAWPSVSIMTISSLFQSMANDLSSFPIKSINCCQDFIYRTAILSEHISKFKTFHNILLSYFERKITHQPLEEKIFSPDELDNLTQIIIYFSKSCEDIKSSLTNMNSLLKASNFQNTPFCLSNNCTPYIGEINVVLFNLISFVTAEINKKGEFIEEPKAIIPSLPFDCSSRLSFVKNIFYSFNEILKKWERFQNVWKGIDRLSHNNIFPSEIVHFSNSLMQLRKEIIDWAELNIKEGKSAFCSQCQDSDLRVGFNNIMPEQQIEDIFLQIIEKTKDCCPSILNFVMNNLTQDFYYIATLLNLISDSAQLSILSSHPKSHNFWKNLLTNLEGFIQIINDLASIQQGTECLASQINPIFLKLNECMPHLKLSFIEIANLVDVKIKSPRYDNKAPRSSFSQHTFIEVLKIMSTAWDTFCTNLNQDTPDSLRVHLAKMIESFNENFKTLYHHLSSLPTINDIHFCNDCSLSIYFDITSSLENVEKMIYSTEWLLRSLWDHNCCNTHAQCIYNLVQKTMYMQNIIPQMQNKDIINSMEEYFLKISKTIDHLHQELHTKILEKKEYHCLFELQEIKVYFDNFQSYTEETVKNMEKYSHINCSSYPHWDTFSSSSRNDCDFMKDLYTDLWKNIHILLQKLPPLLAEQKPAETTSLYSSIKSVKTSLEAMLQTLLNYDIGGGFLCHSCQTQEIFPIIVQIKDEFNIITQEIQLILQIPVMQIIQNTAEKSAISMNIFFGTTINSTRPVTPQILMPREKVDNLYQQVIHTNIIAEEFAKALYTSSEHPNITYT